MLSRRLVRIASSSCIKGRMFTTVTGATVPRMTVSAADAQLKVDKVLEVFQSMAMEDDDKHSEMVYGLSFAHDQANDEAAWKFSVLTDPLMQAQLRESKQQRRKLQNQLKPKPAEPIDASPLPRSLEDIQRDNKRAIVVTEVATPFRVVDVNGAWENLCGYSCAESKGKSLGSLLRGPDTDQLTATALIANLLKGEEAGAILINYAKNGRRFRNRVRVGPIYDNQNRVSHFVGVLQEMKM